MNLKVLCFADLVSVLLDLSLNATLSDQPGTSLCGALPKTGKGTKGFISNGRAVECNNKDKEVTQQTGLCY